MPEIYEPHKMSWEMSHLIFWKSLRKDWIKPSLSVWLTFFILAVFFHFIFQFASDLHSSA